MKKLSALFLCFLFIFLLYSCNKSASTSTQNTATTEITQQNFPTDFAETTQAEPTTVEIPTNPNDPYSVFIKERYEKIYETQKRVDPEAFAEFDKYAKDVYYFFYDIDGNGVDELITGDWKKTTIDIEDPNPPKKILISSIYTIKNGKVVEINTYPWLAEDYIWDRVLLTNGLIRTSSGHKEYPNYVFLGFENGEAVLNCAIYYKGDDIYKQQFADINTSIEITKEEFERLRDEANGNAEPIEINWKRIDEYGR